MIIQFQVLDPATCALMWDQRLPATAGKDLHAELDAIHGVEAVELFRYGMRIDIAPHATTVEAVAEAIAAALSLSLEPVVGPILLEGFEVDAFGDDSFDASAM